ncbi:MAG: DUF5611 family protein [archaeon]|nr:DUF5611 family protein [archaeon]
MDYDIKKGWMKNIKGDLLPNIMKEIFGNVKRCNDQFVSSYGVMAKIKVKITQEGAMNIEIENIPELCTKYSGAALDEAIIDSKKKLNIFVERATGFDVKARKRRIQEKAKKGIL